MSLALAQQRAGTFRECLLDNGVRKVSLELQRGVAGSGWVVDTFKRGLGHHIASYPSQGLTPGLSTVKNGRGGKSPLTGPLANCYGGWDYVARIITLGWANHPGTGGPWSVPGWGTVPKDNGRPYLIGWEFEGGYVDYTDEMMDFMDRCAAGTLDYLGTLPGAPGPAPVECWGEHKDPWAPGRKIDRRNYTAAIARARVTAVRGNFTAPQEDEDPMFTIVAPQSDVTIPLPATRSDRRRFLRFGVDSPAGGTNVRCAVWYDGSRVAALPELDLADGFTGWLHNGGAAEWPLNDNVEALSLHNYGQAPLGVLIETR